MKVEDFVQILNADFFTGVPDSLLKPLGDYLMHLYGINRQHHIIGANEGNCAAIAAGYHLSTGNVPVVYLQNSGEGNIINPVASLLSDEVYGIPVIFVIGWRGEPGIKDEPQHIFQGKITLKLLDVLKIRYFIINEETTVDEVVMIMKQYRQLLNEGKSVAFVIKKGGLTYNEKIVYKNEYELRREDIIKKIISVSGSDPIISTTGKASRELYEAREEKGEGHEHDFLTVGSMGHTSSIALGVALHSPEKRVWCIDGDGSALMHMGAMAVIGTYKPKNLIHIVINNGAHESVGGLPTVAKKVDLSKIALACGYEYVVDVNDLISLDKVLNKAKNSDCLCFIEVYSAIGARADLGRPKENPQDNKSLFIKVLRDKF